MKREAHPYHQQYYGDGSQKKHFMMVIFLAIIGVVAAGLIFGKFDITGNAIKSFDLDKTLEVRAFLSVPEIAFNGDYEEISFSSVKGFLYVDNKKISFTGTDNKVVLKNFEGNFNFKSGEITKIDGKVSEIIVNSAPISLKENGTINVLTDSTITYKKIEVKDPIFLSSLDYISSGQISLKEDNFNINSERVIFKNYFGNLSAVDGSLILDGRVEYLRIEGPLRKISFEN
ncbi:MAG: hypothetical protein Q8Q04_01505 [archaeon]|nr:hypothetical protein [archaeon]